jgi:hypothetical protein
MSTVIRIQSQEAKRLKKDTAFMTFLNEVRENQLITFATSSAAEIEQREEAHAIMRALNLIEAQLDAAIGDEVMLDHSQ